jgi:glutathione S-transferase
MTLILYANPLSPFANKCAIGLDEKGVAFERRTPRSFGTTQTDTAFLAANPYAEVPALVDDGFAVYESAVVFDYIDRRFPRPQLLPQEPRARARALMIARVMDARYDPINWGITELLHFGRVSGARADAVREASAKRAAALNAWLEAELGKADWFGGASFGAADIFVGVHLNGSAGHGFVSPTSPLSSWLARVNTRAAFAKTRDVAQAFMASLTPDSIATWMTVPRQYRDTRLEWVVKVAGLDVIADGLAAGRIWFSREFGE